MEIEIIHDKDNQRFYTVIENKKSELNYKIINDTNTVEYYRTFVDPSLRGKGVAEKLVTFALDYARENHWSIIASCSYVNSFIKRHPKYSPLLNPTP